MRGAIYPTVNLEGITLREADANGQLTEPAVYEIANGGGYSEVRGFAGIPYNVQVEVLGGMSPGDVIEVHISSDKTFNAFVSHSDGPISVSDLTAGQIAVIGLEPEAEYFRFYNNTSRDVVIKIWGIPPRR